MGGQPHLTNSLEDLIKSLEFIFNNSIYINDNYESSEIYNKLQYFTESFLSETTTLDSHITPVDRFATTN